MSQYPPQPPQQPPYGQPPGAPPPYGQPPMPQYGMPGAPMPSGGTSGAAIASLICGIIGCLGITALLSVVLGFVGISATSNRRKTGRGMAIAGLVLGLVWIGIYLLFGSGLYALYVGSKPVKAVAEQFTNYMLKGDVASAGTLCDPAMAQADLQSASDQMKSWGTLTNLTLFGASAQNTNGITQWELGGSAQFSNTTPKTATFSLRKESDGSYKIIKFNFK